MGAESPRAAYPWRLTATLSLTHHTPLSLFSAHAATPSRRRNPPVGGRLSPICRASTRARDRCLLPSPGLTFHIGRPEGSSSSPQQHPSAGAPPQPLCVVASAVIQDAVVHVVHAARGAASNSTVPARGVALRSDPGGQAPCARARSAGQAAPATLCRFDCAYQAPGGVRPRAAPAIPPWGSVARWAGKSFQFARCHVMWGRRGGGRGRGRGRGRVARAEEMARVMARARMCGRGEARAG